MIYKRLVFVLEFCWGLNKIYNGVFMEYQNYKLIKISTHLRRTTEQELHE